MNRKLKHFAMPQKFHTMIKLEAIKNGKTVTKYMEEIAEEAEERNLELRQRLLRGSKNEKKFIPRF